MRKLVIGLICVLGVFVLINAYTTERDQRPEEQIQAENRSSIK